MSAQMFDNRTKGVTGKSSGEPQLMLSSLSADSSNLATQESLEEIVFVIEFLIKSLQSSYV
jgi:hypothetical protein